MAIVWQQRIGLQRLKEGDVVGGAGEFRAVKGGMEGVNENGNPSAHSSVDPTMEGSGDRVGIKPAATLHPNLKSRR